MINIYQYIYYRVYLWDKKKWGKSDNPDSTAQNAVTIIMFLNINPIFLILKFCGIDIYNTRFSFYLLIPLILFTFIINEFVFFSKYNHKKVINKFEKETILERKKNTVIIFLFVVFSIISNIILGIILGKLERGEL
jgi:hypothetical protein